MPPGPGLVPWQNMTISHTFQSINNVSPIVGKYTASLEAPELKLER